MCSLLWLVGACAGPAPQVKVIGVSQADQARPRADNRQLVVFVEVVNPTSRDLQLSRLEYRLDAASWFQSDGRVPLARAIPADSSAVVEILVPVKPDRLPDAGAVSYSLQGRLYVVDKQVERSWPVQVTGELNRDRVVLGPATRVRVAEQEQP